MGVLAPRSAHAKKLSLSSICQQLEFSFYLKIEVVFDFPKKWSPLPFAEKLRSSSNSYELSGSTLTEKCWKINFPGRGWRVGVAGLSKNKANSAFKLSLTWSWGWAWQNFWSIFSPFQEILSTFCFFQQKKLRNRSPGGPHCILCKRFSLALKINFSGSWGFRIYINLHKKLWLFCRGARVLKI